MTLVHVGSVVVDLVAEVPALPVHGSDVLAARMAPAPGGGFTVMTAAARQGMPVRYAGPHGTGPWGDLARAALAAEGVAVVAPRRATDTGLVVTLVDGAGERTFVTSPEAAVGATAADLARVVLAAGDTVYASGYGLLHPPTRDALVAWVGALPETVTVVVDPGPLAPSVAPDALAALLRRADWCSLNLREAAEVLGAGGAAPVGTLAARLAARTGRGVVVRAGAAGCAVAAPGVAATEVAGFPVRAVDTTGAGDTHTGVLVAHLARGVDPVAAARTANAAAALAVTRRGPGTAPTAAELAAFLASSR